mgnify:FL=1
MKKYLNISKKVRVGLAVLVGIIGLFLVFRPKPRMNDSLDEVEVTDSVEVKEIVCKYGIPVDHYDISYGIVQPNQNLSYILGDHGLSSADIHELNEKAREYLM